jgi:NAD(P)-dependent dehydrogenase (short-subunit alcohol dehydrogenase family)
MSGDLGAALEGRHALVTGASQGVGRAIAVGLAGEGATVVLAARSRAGLEETAAHIDAVGGSAIVVPTDLRAASEIEALAQHIESELGHLDTIVCNTGIAGPTAELWKVTPDEWDETLRVNLTGTFLVCRALLPAMVDRGSGSVVVIGSSTGKRPLYGRTPYAASKMALVGLVRTLAAELGPLGLRVNLISPGGVDGPRVRDVVRQQARALGSTDEAVLEEYLKVTPLRRLVAPEQIADAVAFLASDAAASITGEDLNVSCGATMH